MTLDFLRQTATISIEPFKEIIMVKLKKRQRDILSALRELGGQATTKAIAEKVGLNTNGVAQSLGALGAAYARRVGGKGSTTIWKLP